MAEATALFSIGSTVLLAAASVAALSAFSAPAGLAIFLGGWLAVFIHLAAWGRLTVAIRVVGSRIGSALRSAFLASLFGLVIGLAAFASEAGGYWYALFLAAVFPFVPLVWAPVAIAHACLFLLAGRFASGRLARALVGIGCLWLFAISAWALAVGRSYSDLSYAPMWMFAGLTAPGYLVLAAGWRRASAVTLRWEGRLVERGPSSPASD